MVPLQTGTACDLHPCVPFSPPCRQVETEPYPRTWAQQGLQLSPDQMPCSAKHTVDRLAVTALQIAIFRVSSAWVRRAAGSSAHSLHCSATTAGPALAAGAAGQALV